MPSQKNYTELETLINEKIEDVYTSFEIYTRNIDLNENLDFHKKELSWDSFRNKTMSYLSNIIIEERDKKKLAKYVDQIFNEILIEKPDSIYQIKELYKLDFSITGLAFIFFKNAKPIKLFSISGFD